MNGPLTSISRGTFELGHAAQSQFRWAMVDITSLLEEARVSRDLSPLAAIGLGQLMAATVMITRLVAKRPTRLLIEIAGDGPLRTIRAEADTLGHLRGLVGNPLAEGDLSGNVALGTGMLKVIRQTEKDDNYESKVQLVGGGIASNVANYLHISEQVRSAVLLGVQAGPSGIASAGGLIVQAMPGADPNALALLESVIAESEPVSALLESGGSQGLLHGILGGFGPESLHESELALKCDCERERFEHHIRALVEREPDILDGDEDIEVECSFCGARYEFGTDEFRPPSIH